MSRSLRATLADCSFGGWGSKVLVTSLSWKLGLETFLCVYVRIYYRHIHICVAIHYTFHTYIYIYRERERERERDRDTCMRVGHLLEGGARPVWRSGRRLGVPNFECEVFILSFWWGGRVLKAQGPRASSLGNLCLRWCWYET